MALTATATGTGEEFATLSRGTHFARLVSIIDLGTQTSAEVYGGKKQHKVLFQFEILGDEKRTDGKPFLASKRYTVSLHEKASLRKDIEAWQGNIPEAQAASYPLTSLLGKPCQLSITHRESDGRTYSDIAAIMAMPKGMPAIPGEMPLTVFDLDARDMDVFNALHERLQDQIRSAPEWTQGPTAGAAPEGDPFA